MNSSESKRSELAGGGRPPVVESGRQIQRLVQHARRDGKTVGLVPTMGALHTGHLSLVERAAAECDFVVVTIFVNPTQFAPHEDFAKYPRMMDADLDVLAAYPVDVVFSPRQDEMYPPGYSTYVDPPAVAEPLEGACRPGHFRGVATVVLKLFHLAPADVAYFGQKDYQQTLVIRRMVDDLNLPIRVQVCPTVREPDGLAMSSRNRYLSAEERTRSLAVSACLELAARRVREGPQAAAGLAGEMQEVLHQAGIRDIDYVALVDPETLVQLDPVKPPALAAVAVRVGSTRLIDNRLLQ